MVKVRYDKRDRSKYFETGYTVLFGLSKYQRKRRRRRAILSILTFTSVFIVADVI